MSAPRLERDLVAVEHNARTLVSWLAPRGIGVTGVTKSSLGDPAVARAFLAGGATGLGEARIENVERLRASGVRARITLIRSPMPSQVEQVVEHCDTSCNTELDVIAALSNAARRRGVVHEVIVMVELGDRREGVLPADVLGLVRRIEDLPNVALRGIGANLACRSGVVPDDSNMGQLSALAARIEHSIERPLDVVSGGNSSNLRWALAAKDVARVDDLRLGEAVLLGCDPLDRAPIEGLRTDAFRLVAEVIESKAKPSVPWGSVGQSAFGEPPRQGTDRGAVVQTILAIGLQDTDAADLTAPVGTTIVGASSDHLIIESDRPMRPGDEVAFRPGYSALLRSMTSPFVTTVDLDATDDHGLR